MQATTSNRRRVVTLATAIFATFIIGVAFAAWTATGTGSGNATTYEEHATPLGVNVAQVSGLYPTQPAQTVSVTVTNPHPYKVDVNSIQITGKSATEGCNVAALATPGTAYTWEAGTHKLGAAGSEDAAKVIQLPAAVQLTNDANEACKGATFTVNYRVDGLSTN